MIARVRSESGGLTPFLSLRLRSDEPTGLRIPELSEGRKPYPKVGSAWLKVCVRLLILLQGSNYSRQLKDSPNFCWRLLDSIYTGYLEVIYALYKSHPIVRCLITR